ncbi:hypothetical protein RD110_22510 [Rhodoferax koreense]|uniref:Uncharacterized protein n=1 Tax=Rhodoferax koreensis TaxID=1842727 RepID=A0A1P8K4E2_9BURK|nr:hypothetical protein [Rhodoferax koreense]APW40885.1 hypothetical protein RD110_22510 [Rhodoferax koreense]
MDAAQTSGTSDFLAFPPQVRARLIRVGALSRNAADQEVLRGLTVEESEFLAGWHDTGLRGRRDDEFRRFYALWRKHEEARLQEASPT